MPFIELLDWLSPETLVEHEQAIYQRQGALPAHDVDRLIKEDAERFIANAKASMQEAERVDESDFGRS